MNSLQVSTEGTAVKKWWQSSNFWTDIIMIIAAVFVGFPTEDGTAGVTAIFALIGAGKAIREFLKSGVKPSILKPLQDSNFWNYVATVAVAIIPSIPIEIFDSLQIIASNLIGGNWQGAIVAAFSLVTILYNLLKKSSPQTVPVTQT